MRRLFTFTVTDIEVNPIRVFTIFDVRQFLIDVQGLAAEWAMKVRHTKKLSARLDLALDIDFWVFVLSDGHLSLLWQYRISDNHLVRAWI